MSRLGWWSTVVSCCVLMLAGCSSVIEVRLENVSTRDFSNVTVAGLPYGDLVAGELGEYQAVELKFGYMVVKMTIDGRYVNAQSLNLGAKRFTHRIDIRDLAARQLAVEVVRD